MIHCHVINIIITSFDMGEFIRTLTDLMYILDNTHGEEGRAAHIICMYEYMWLMRNDLVKWPRVAQMAGLKARILLKEMKRVRWYSEEHYVLLMSVWKVALPKNFRRNYRKTQCARLV
jgi:hypothetical protein